MVVRAGLNQQNFNEADRCNSSVTHFSDGAVVEFLCDPPALAKYVTLNKDEASPMDGRTSLKIAEVSVYEYATKECAKQSGRNCSKTFCILTGWYSVGILFTSFTVRALRLKHNFIEIIY